MSLNSFLPSISDAISDWVRSHIEKGVPNGLFCTDVDEPICKFDQAPCETVYEGKNDSWIVLGRDRTSNLTSGAGGKGLTSCGMIDLVVGRMASYQVLREKKKQPPLNKKSKVSSNFVSDAARIYITQKSLGVDEVFGFKKETGPSSVHKSAIGIKSDHTRIIGRESVRIYAGKARFAGLPPGGETCANGDEISSGSGRIEFVAANANEDDLEPIVLGNKLKEFLLHQNSLFAGILSDIMHINSQLATINMVLSALPGAGAGFQKQITDNINKITSTIRQGFQVRMDDFNYLDKAIIPGKKSIFSNSVYST